MAVRGFSHLLRSQPSFAFSLRFTSQCFEPTKVSYFHNPGKEPLKQLTVGLLLDNAAKKWPDRTALISYHQNDRITFKQAQSMANKLASGLLRIGFQPGDRVGILSTSNSEYYIVAMAAAKSGIVLVNINPAFKRDELEYCLRQADMKGLITEEEFKTQKYYEMVCSIVDEIKNTPSDKSFTSKSMPSFTTLVVNTDKKLPGAWRLKDVMSETSNEVDQVQYNLQPEDPFNIQFSSGTTGKPKAALLNHFTLINNSFLFCKRIGFHKTPQTVCLQVPLFHTFGMSLGILGALNHGATLIIPSPTFNSEASMNVLRQERCTAIYGTPTMYIDLCNQIKQNKDSDLNKGLQNFQVLVSGGAVCSPHLFQLMSQTFNCNNVASAYGMTETSPILMTNTDNDTYEQRVTTVGYVADHTEVKVVDDNGKMVPFGTVGEAWFRSYSVMLGYFGDEGKTREIMTPCKWIKTGDLFILHENGYGQVVGRKKDVIIRGGENIFPAEIEEFLETHPDVIEAQVYGISDQRMGEEVCASVILKPNKTLTEENIKQYCKDKIAHFKIPKYINITEEFPKTASGKIQKFLLRQQMEDKLKKQKP